MDDFDPIDDEMRLDEISRNDDPDDVNYEQETDIDSGVTTTVTLNEVELEHAQTCLDNFYKEAAEKYRVVPNTRAKPEDFIVVNGEFRYRKYPNVEIMNKKGTKFLAPSSIMRLTGGHELLKDMFGDQDIIKHMKSDRVIQKEITSENISQLENRLKSLNEEETTVKKPMSADEISNELSSSLKRMSEQPSFSDREYAAFDRFIQTAQGNLHVQREKLASINADINKISERLKTEIDEEEIAKLRKELNKLEDLKEVTLESIQLIRKQYINQIAHIKSTIQSILHEDTTLAERIKTLFREQGITIVSVLTAFGMIISTIVVSLTGGGSGPPPPTPPSDGNGVKEWVKKTLDKLANFLKYLGEKALAALPGIIGSIFSWLLNTASKAVGWLADHAWFTLISVGILIMSYVEKKFHYIYNKK